MANVTGIDLNPILQRLNGVEPYHPFDAETFSDWATEAGDIVTISRNGETYVSPVHTSRMVWKGKAPTMQISTTGNEKRDAVSRVSRKKYGRGSAGVRSQEGIHRNFVSEDGILHSELHITESYLRTEFHDETNSLRSEFDMTASHMRTEFLDQVHSLRSEFEVTASHLRTEFEDDVNSLRGEFEVTASHLRTEFEDDINSLRGEFEVTASHLRTEFTDEVHSLRGEFEVTASGLRTEFEDDVNSVRSYVAQTASSWDARVEGVIDENGNVTAASIAVAVNAEGSQARINADRIYLLGQTIANTIDANYIATKIESISSLLAQNITAGDIDASSVKVRPVAGMGAINVATAYNGSSLTQSGNTYTLRLAKMNGEYDEYSFSRATTLSGAWSGRRFTVTASPQGNEFYTDLWSAVPVSNITWNGTVATLALNAAINGDETTYSAGTVTADVGSFLQDKTGATKKFTANGLYSADSGYVGFGNIEIDVPQSTVEPTTLSIQWNGSRRLNANASPQGVSRYTEIVSSIPNSDITFSGTTLTLPLKATYDGGETTVAVGNVTANISGKLQTKTITSNGTVNPDAGYIGFGSVTVSVPVTNAGARFGAASGSYFVEAYDKTSGTSIADSSTGYKLGLSGTKVQIQNASGTKYGDTPEYTIPLETKTISSNGTVNPSSGKVGFSSVTVAVPSDLPNARVRFGAANNAYYVEAYDSSSAGGTSIAGSSVTYKLGLSGTKVQVQNASGTQFASTPEYTIPLETKSITANGTYAPSSGKVGFSSVTVAVPSDLPNAKARFGAANGSYYIEAYNSSGGTSIQDSSVTYKLGKSGNNVQVQNSNNAKITNTPEYDMSTDLTNATKSGWSSYWNRLQYPKAKTNAGTPNDACMTVYYPDGTYDSAYDKVAKVYTISSGDNTAYMKDASGNVMAQITHNKYKNGKADGNTAAGVTASWSNNVYTVERAADTATKKYTCTVTVNTPSFTYNTSTHKYTATAIAYGNAEPRETKTNDSGTEAYNDGYNANTSGWIAYDKDGATINKGYLAVGRYIHAYTNNIDGVARNSGGYWWVPSAWFRYVSGAGSNHQGDLASDSYIELIYTKSDASGDVRGTGATWHVPASGGGSHSISVSRQWTFGGSGYDTGGKLKGGAFSKSGLSVRTYYYITVSCGGTSKQIYFVCND